ncbi:MAG: SixA phosphatase family protein [Flavobacterium sp.]
MKNLILIRHAKSSWEIPLRDIDRPLSHRGLSDAHLVSEASMLLIPKSNAICCSPAKRTRETAVIFAQNLGWPLDRIMYLDSLYTFDGFELTKIIKSSLNGYENVIVFGHNEAITEFVNTFGDLYIDNVPTCGLVHLQFEVGDWSEIKKGKTIRTIFPRDLKND